MYLRLPIQFVDKNGYAWIETDDKKKKKKGKQVDKCILVYKYTRIKNIMS